MISNARSASLRDWARGDLALEASVELLIRALRGRLLDGPWVRRRDLDGYWFDPGLAAAESSALSGGERRVLTIATRLASTDHPVDLSVAITGLDPGALRCVLEALAHAVGYSVSLDDPHGDLNEPG